MGNWMTVNMIGKCNADEIEKLKSVVNIDVMDDNFHPLSYYGHSLCGIGDWVDEEISAIGNLAERDYSVEDIISALEFLTKSAPSLELTIHCGGDYESKECVATLVLKNGKVEKLKPQVRDLMGISKSQVEGNALKCLMSKRGD